MSKTPIVINRKFLEPHHREIFEYVETTLEKNGKNQSLGDQFPFRKRSDHIYRVYRWTQRLMENRLDLDREAVYVAALFHDIGYACLPRDMRKHHAPYSAEIAQAYLREAAYPDDFVQTVAFLVGEHSKKRHLQDKTTSPELIVLLESDLLDETGALSMVWDCMMEGAQADQSFEKALEHLEHFTLSQHSQNPMTSPLARSIWQDKQALVRGFIQSLRQDLFAEEDANAL